MPVRALAPQASASANSATFARGRGRVTGGLPTVKTSLAPCARYLPSFSPIERGRRRGGAIRRCPGASGVRTDDASDAPARAAAGAPSARSSLGSPNDPAAETTRAAPRARRRRTARRRDRPSAPSRTWRNAERLAQARAPRTRRPGIAGNVRPPATRRRRRTRRGRRSSRFAHAQFATRAALRIESTSARAHPGERSTSVSRLQYIAPGYTGDRAGGVIEPG
jgi:hypothetical protein